MTVGESMQEMLNFLQAVECRDSTYIPRNYQFVAAKAKGSWVYDPSGREYIDLCAGFGSLPLGHNMFPDRDDDTITTGMGDLFPSQSKIELLATLHRSMPPYLSRIALTVTGSQAVEMALRTALLATGCSGFIALQDCYHGLDLGVLALTAMPKFKKPFSPLLNVEVEHVPLGCDLEEILCAVHRQRKTGTAALIIEPVQGRGGARACFDSWLHEVSAFCRQQKILLIFDEIFSGLGRTGQLTKASTVACDLICLGKALGGGMPVSAVLGREEVMQAWPLNRGEALFTGTFFGHPLSCIVATHTLQTIVAQELSQRARSLGAQMLTHLTTALKHNSLVQEVRGQGLLIAVVFQRPQSGVALAQRLMHKGIIAVPGGASAQCLNLSPALNIPSHLLFSALDTITAEIEELAG